jgi:hypothetical protein
VLQWVLQWVREQKPPCPWDGDTLTYAAEGGHLEVFKWALEHGCLSEVYREW